MGLEKKNKYLGINCAHPLLLTRSYHSDKKKVRYCINERTTVEWYKQIVESHNGFIVLICRHCTRILRLSPSLDFPYVGWGALSSDCPELSLSMCLSNSHNRLLFFSASRTLYTWICARGWKENRKSDVRMPIHKVTPISDSPVLNQLPTRLHGKVSSLPGRCSIYPFPGSSQFSLSISWT